MGAVQLCLSCFETEFIYSFATSFSSIHFVLGAVINAGDVEIRKTAASLYHGASSIVGEQSGNSKEISK